ncbi:16S rRNA (cytidine(1402)-2'-O)-methyltransferase [Leeia aquatica]|uniref:Ribosomal RNA small subunit methyltransferase I n=1 Tax=Leeia aquatica TaxID=2725557 RepID=A0A847SGH4_9NEIS|nr:16S rRNA (cytidine(1402)-2'-O)-methyltransferase [Leeia aquatica]NLR76358.1 16S rRNA (cytidine(1402)-2'-O)-methyltransferase [Leeia aquatica]
MAQPDNRTVGTLYVVATPIGNLQDLTVRARDVLSRVTLLAAEDTRVSSGLMRHIGAQPRMLAVHEHNERAAAEKLLQHLQAGEDVALVSDAGTPGISDPGARVVAAMHQAGVRVEPLPGPSAVVTALSASGFERTAFRFIGFLPPKHNARLEAIRALSDATELLVLYEAPHRILDCMQDLLTGLGAAREVVVCRELTKTFETIRRGTLGELLPWMQADPNQQRGEFVIVLDGAPERVSEGLEEEQERVLQILLAELPVKQAVALATRISGAPRNLLYSRALELKAQED